MADPATHASPAAIWEGSRLVSEEHAPDVLLGLGGFTCLPAVLAARMQRVPVALLEINTTAGRATRALAPLARRVLHAWPPLQPA